jgi:hypothetical protein
MNSLIDSKYRKEISQYTKSVTNISGIYKETLRALIHSFSSFRYLNSENEAVKVKCQYANPERSVAKLFQENNIILPVISVEQILSEEDGTRVRFGSILLHETYWDEDTQRGIRILSLPPKAINITYKVNLWAKYKEDLDQLLEQIRLSFNPALEIPTKFSTQTKAYLLTEEDLGDPSVNTGQDRVLKRGLNIKVETYVPSPKFRVTSTGKVEVFVTTYGVDGVDEAPQYTYLDKDHPKYGS